jgi:hypothetical protein
VRASPDRIVIDLLLSNDQRWLSGWDAVRLALPEHIPADQPGKRPRTQSTSRPTPALIGDPVA